MSGCIIPATNNIIKYEIDSHITSEHFINALRECLYFIRITAAMMMMTKMTMKNNMPITPPTTAGMCKEPDYMHMLAIADTKFINNLTLL